MKSTFKPQVKKPKIKLGATARMILLYFVASIAAFSALTSLGNSISSQNQPFTILVVGMLLLGVLHVWMMIRFFEWDRPVLQKTLFTVGVTVIAIAVLYFLLPESGNKELSNYYLITPLAFCLPHFYKMAVDQIISIPQERYKAFFIRTFDDIDRGNISFEENDRGLIFNFETDNDDVSYLGLPMEPVRVFAPKQVFHMPFKTVFKAFVLYHNEKLHTETPIHVFAESETGEKQPYAWYFMHRPTPLKGLQYIDPDKTVSQNEIRFLKQKTNYGKEILAAEFMVIRKQIKVADQAIAPTEHEEDATGAVPDTDSNNTGATSPRLEF